MIFLRPGVRWKALSLSTRLMKIIYLFSFFCFQMIGASLTAGYTRNEHHGMQLLKANRSNFQVHLLSVSDSASPRLRLPKIFGEGMVLQRHQQIGVWGWAAPLSLVTVQLHKQQKKIKTDSSGKWKVSLDPETAGGPFELAVSSSKEKIIIKDVLIGDVWICSGQSNMAFNMKRSLHAEAE